MINLGFKPSTRVITSPRGTPILQCLQNIVGSHEITTVAGNPIQLQQAFTRPALKIPTPQPQPFWHRPLHQYGPVGPALCVAHKPNETPVNIAIMDGEGCARHANGLIGCARKIASQASAIKDDLCYLKKQ